MLQNGQPELATHNSLDRYRKTAALAAWNARQLLAVPNCYIGVSSAELEQSMVTLNETYKQLLTYPQENFTVELSEKKLTVRFSDTDIRIMGAFEQ